MAGMIISHRHKFIFLKTRKTAGTSIESFLRGHLGEEDICTGSVRHSVEPLNNPGLTGHVGWKTIKALVTEEQWGSYYKFGFERNPFTKVVSDYIFKKSIGSQPTDFDDYLLKWVVTGKISDWSRYTRENVPVAYMYQLEHLQGVMGLICRRMNISLNEFKDTKPRNMRDPNHHQSYNPRQINLVVAAFKNELDYFGWEVLSA